MDFEDLAAMIADREEPRLVTPEVDALVELGGVANTTGATTRWTAALQAS